MIPGNINSLMMGNSTGVDIGDNIANSLMLDSTAGQYLSRTPGSESNRTTWTFHVALKRGKLGVTQCLLDAYSPGYELLIQINSDDTLSFIVWNASSNVGVKQTNRVFRDPSAWYDIVVVLDTTNAAATDRMRIYVNGIRESSFLSSTDPAQNTLALVNTTYQHRIGSNYNAVYNSDGYLSDVHFIDGQALDPSYFGKFSTDTSQWIPKSYTGTYGVNGFKLDFTNGAALGADSSGNGNNWTLNGGINSTNQYTDTPTNNYTVGTAIDPHVSLNSGSWYKGNTEVGCASGGPTVYTISTIPLVIPTYYEVTVPSNGGYGQGVIGLWDGITVGASIKWIGTGGDYPTYGTYGIAFDPVTGGIWIKTTAGAWVSGDPVTKTSPISSLSTSTTWFAIMGASRTSGFNNPGYAIYNFGQRPFAYTPPTGFKSLCTQNMPDPSIINPKKYFDVLTYTGTGVAHSITGAQFQPDLLWVKDRTIGTNSHILNDSVRGVGKNIYSNLTNVEDTTGFITSLDPTGFSVSTLSGANQNGSAHVAWNWKKGTVPGFDIVSYTGTGVARTVSHNLGSVPKTIIVKARNVGQNWGVWHNDIGIGYTLHLNDTTAKHADTTMLNNTSPTNNNISLGTSSDVNTSGQPYIAYLFAEVPGFSKFGSYTGNGITDGPFVWCGFRPAFILIKEILTSSYSWAIWDSKRGAYNVDTGELFPNLPIAEQVTNGLDILANGFKIRNTSAAYNTSGGTYIYMVFAEAPFKYANAR